MKHIIFSLLITTIVLSGCRTGRSIPTRYYVLEYPDELEINIADTLAPLQRSCSIETVNIYPAYSTNQIAIRENTHEIRYFSFNQWAMRPEQNLTVMINDFIKKNNIFHSIHSTGPIQEADYIFETSVYHIQLVNEVKEYHAHLNIEYRLRDNQTGQVVLNHRADRKKLLEDQNLNFFAAAISKIFIEELSYFANSILTELK